MTGLLGNSEYRGIFEAMKKIFNEEGFLAFYRGYSAYMIAVRFFLKFTDPFLDERAASRD